MKYRAQIQNKPGEQEIQLKVGEKEQKLAIQARSGGGSAVSGGELLFLALATCYCNDIYREAAKWNIKVESVEVEVEGDFEAPGQPASNLLYRAHVRADASEDKIRELMLHTDIMAEIHKTLRVGTPVKLEL